jgi:hypothetical protein
MLFFYETLSVNIGCPDVHANNSYVFLTFCNMFFQTMGSYALVAELDFHKLKDITILHKHQKNS